MRTETEEPTDALEMIRCAQANLENLGGVAPFIRKAVMFSVVQMQLKDAEAALTAERQLQRARLQPG
jgi:hypothetical protein